MPVGESGGKEGGEREAGPSVPCTSPRTLSSHLLNILGFHARYNSKERIHGLKKTFANHWHSPHPSPPPHLHPRGRHLTETQRRSHIFLSQDMFHPQQDIGQGVPVCNRARTEGRERAWGDVELGPHGTPPPWETTVAWTRKAEP